MVNFQGNFLPCMILRESTKIPKGYGVYLFHIQEEIDVPARTILGNLKALMHCEVSFLDKNGLLSTGYVRSTDWRKNKSGGPLNFFVCCKDTRDYIWVSFPYIFLNKEQSSVFCCWNWIVHWQCLTIFWQY